jgi:Na+-translocating ferredoxin:NAD+ oxidoreductase RnfC subunit
MALFSKGLVLEQHKEPAFSRGLVRLLSPSAEAAYLDTVPDVPAEDLTADQLIQIARDAGIVDERDGKFLYRKLLRAKGKTVAVIADAVDDEPYVSSQINPLLKLRGQATAGLALCERVAQSGNVFIMAYKNVTDLETRIPNVVEGYKVVKLRGGYPAESRAKALKLEAGRKLIVGAGALIHFSRAVYKRRPQTSIFITVAGNCIANPMNIEVSLGTSVMQVLERCGLAQEPTRVVCGGPMTGIAIIDPERTLVTHTTRAVLAFRENIAARTYHCIGCGRCEQVCPTGLNPMYMYRFTKRSYFANLEPFDAHLCTGCGTCSYVCPSGLNLAGTIRTAKEYAVAHFIEPAEEEDDLDS